MRVLALAVCLVNVVAVAEPPRVAVHPLVVVGPDENLNQRTVDKWLYVAADQPISMVSSFEVRDALAAVPGGQCQAQPECLVKLCEKTQASFALLGILAIDGKQWLFSGMIAKADGTVVRKVDLLQGRWSGAASPAAVDAMMKQLFVALSLNELSSAPAGTEPTPVATDVPMKEPPPIELKPAAAPAPAPVYVEAPTRWNRSAATVTGVVAVAAAAAGGTLLVVNGAEASNLAASMRNGLVPPERVSQAAGIDERNTAAIGFFVGAGVAAATAAIFALVFDAPSVPLAPAPGSVDAKAEGR